MRSLYVLPLAAALAAWALPAVAAACSPLPQNVFEVRPDPTDTTPPGPAQYVLGPIGRGDATGNSALCSDLGGFGIEVTPPAGEDPDEIGYRVAVESGTTPDRFTLPPYDMVPFDGLLPFDWIDGICLEQEPFAFLLRITPIDRAGNEGPSALLPVAHPGRAPGQGCGDPGEPVGVGGAGGGVEQETGEGGAGGFAEDAEAVRTSDDPDEPAPGCTAAGAGVSPLAALAALLIRRHKRSS